MQNKDFQSALRRCPFCGAKAKLYMKEDVCFIYCSECDCQARQRETVEEAIEAWNTRKPMDEVVEQLEESSSFVTKEGLRLIPVVEATNIVKKGGIE